MHSDGFDADRRISNLTQYISSYMIYEYIIINKPYTRVGYILIRQELTRITIITYLTYATIWVETMNIMHTMSWT